MGFMFSRPVTPFGSGSSSSPSSSSSSNKPNPQVSGKATSDTSWETVKRMFDIDDSDDEDDFEVLDPNSALVKSIKWMTITKPSEKESRAVVKEDPHKGERAGVGGRSASSVSLKIQRSIRREPVPNDREERVKWTRGYLQQQCEHCPPPHVAETTTSRPRDLESEEGPQLA